MPSQKILETILSQKRYRLTTPRLLVFRTLQDNPPIKISSLIKQLEHQVNRVTIYRTIRLYEQLGIINRLSIGWKYKLELSDIFSKHHHHITCQNCGLIVSIKESSTIEKSINQIVENSGFTNITHQLEFQGYCAKCQTTR